MLLSLGNGGPGGCECWSQRTHTFSGRLKKFTKSYDQIRRQHDVWKKTSDLRRLRENKPPAPTGIRKDNSWSICQLSVAVPTNMLKQESLAQTNLVYNRPSLSRDLHWRIKFQGFCDQTANSPYIYALKYRTKTALHSQRDSAVSRICEQTKEAVWARKFVLFDSCKM